MWRLAIIFLIGAAFSFGSVFFPQWDLRWGRRGASRVSMSVEGRIIFGIFFAYGCGWMFLGNGTHNSFWMAIYVMLLVGVAMVYRRDKKAKQDRSK